MLTTFLTEETSDEVDQQIFEIKLKKEIVLNFLFINLLSLQVPDEVTQLFYQ